MRLDTIRYIDDSGLGPDVHGRAHHLLGKVIETSRLDTDVWSSLSAGGDMLVQKPGTALCAEGSTGLAV